MVTINSSNEPTAASGKVLQGQGIGTASTFSTATYPSVGTGTGTLLRADGTNWVATTSTYPNTNATNTLLYASSANVMAALATANNGVLKTDGSGVPSIGTATIAVGGTNATSFGTSSGVVVYNGTSLVNYAGPKINSSGLYTNTSQPSFYCYMSSPVSNVTGDGTGYSVLFDTTEFDQGSNVTLNSGGKTIFTCPIAGVYLLTASVSLTGIAVGQNLFNFDILCSAGGTSVRLNGPSPIAVKDTNSQCGFTISVVRYLPISTTCNLVVTVVGGAKGVGLNGTNGGYAVTTFSGCLLC